MVKSAESQAGMSFTEIVVMAKKPVPICDWCGKQCKNQVLQNGALSIILPIF